MRRVVRVANGGWSAAIVLAAALVHCGGDKNPTDGGPDKNLTGGAGSADASPDTTAPNPSSTGGAGGTAGVQDTAQHDAATGPEGDDAAASGPDGAGGAAGAAGAGGNDGGADVETLADSDAGRGPSLPPGGVDWEAWPAVEPVPANTCRVSWFYAENGTSPTIAHRSEVWTFDAGVRVLSRQPVAADDSVSYVRLDSQRRREMVCLSQPQSSIQPFVCEEWQRDASGNALSDAFYGVDEGPLDASVLDPAHPRKQAYVAGGESTRYTHKYDDLGRIQSTVSYFPGNAWLTFSRDTGGRCSEVLWQVRADSSQISLPIEEIDHWNYTGDQLTSRVITNVKDADDIRGVISYSYDADGTLAATVVDGALDFPQPYRVERPLRDGLADYIVRTQKQADGGRWIEVLRFGSNGNLQIKRNGKLASANRWRYFLSPGCADLGLPVHTSQDCEFERPTSMLPLGWNNPYVTPVPIGTPSPLPN